MRTKRVSELEEMSSRQLAMIEGLTESAKGLLNLYAAQKGCIDALMIAQSQNASVINQQAQDIANLRDELHVLRAQVNLNGQG